MGRSVRRVLSYSPCCSKRIQEMNKAGEKSILKTWSRASTIFPDFVGHTIAVHDGRNMCRCMSPEDMVGP